MIGRPLILIALTAASLVALPPVAFPRESSALAAAAVILPERAAPATTAPATRAGVDGPLVQPVAAFKWEELLSLAMHGGKLEVRSKPPPSVFGYMVNRKPVDVEITNSAERYWQLQGIASQRQPFVGGAGVIIGGGGAFRVGPARAIGAAGAAAGAKPDAARPVAVDFAAGMRSRGRGRDRVSAAPQLAGIIVMNGTLRISGRWFRDDQRLFEVQFRSYADRTNVSLTVRESTRGRRAPVLAVESNDLQHLRRSNPNDVRLYLEPLLCEICGGRNPLRPQPGDIYRAFESIPPESGALDHVRRLVERFDALEPAVREAASAELHGLGRPGVLAAARIDHADLSAEQALRLDAFVARYSSVADIAAARHDPLFLVDCLEDDDRAVRAAALKELRETTGRDIDFDLDAPPAQRAAATIALAAQFLPPASAPASAPASQPVREAVKQ